VPDLRLVEEIAADLGTSPGLIEKDWHVVRAIGVIAQVDTAGMMPAFSGGTSLSKGWELIKRFSEDIDFKVGEPPTSSASRGRRERTAYRERVLDALTGVGFELEGKPVSGNESRYFSADLDIAENLERGRGCGRTSASKCRSNGRRCRRLDGQSAPCSPQRKNRHPKCRRFLAWIRLRRRPTS